MKRLAVGMVVGLLAGTALGFGLGILAFPFWFLNDRAQEMLAEGVSRSRHAGGTFIHVNPSDPIHWGKGTVTLYREDKGGAVLHLEDDFEVGPGPRYHLYLVDRAEVRSDRDFQAARSVDLGRLRAFKGSQVYTLPTAVDASQYASIVVWCRAFDVLISPASLDPAK